MIVQNDIVEALIQEELEVYVIKDHEKLRKIVTQYPDSVILVNISEQMPEGDWERWIRGIMADQATARVDIGILCPNGDAKLQQKYVNILKLKCGYIQVKSDSKVLFRQLMEALKAANARGQRKHIRAALEGDAVTAINLPVNGDFIKGTLKDISTVGLSCVFERDPGLGKNSLCQDVQIKLQSMILKIEGIVFGSRIDGDTKIYVIVFTQRTDPAVRAKIRKYIQTTLQSRIDAEFK
ncbi:pilus assembly protein PilZ [Treponema primitia]|uniref:pilus assembly protein PilZ n=1 Tax=Treponema primitia TaxID=88058 RepID=UPI001FDF45DA|nr:pilus assembly protein PilZ [Treponema primitia]